MQFTTTRWALGLTALLLSLALPAPATASEATPPAPTGSGAGMHAHGDHGKHGGDGAAPGPDEGGHAHRAHGGASHGHGDGHGARIATTDHRMPTHLQMDHAGFDAELRTFDRGGYLRSRASYAMPQVTLRDQHGRAADFTALLDHDGPVLLNFIFTSCATICPVMSATFAEVQARLAGIDDGYRMISVSIDPEYDTPARLRDYAALHEARANWVFLTGDIDTVFEVVRAFDAVYKSDNKMYHLPLTFLRPAPDKAWLRLEGLLSARELAGEYAHLVMAHGE